MNSARSPEGARTADGMPANARSDVPSLAVAADLLGGLLPMARLSPRRREELARVSRRELLPGPRRALPLAEWHAEEQAVYLLKGQLRLDCRSGSTCVMVGGSPEAALPLACRQDAPREAKTVTAVEILRLDGRLLDLTVTWDELVRSSPAGADEQRPDWGLNSAFAPAALADGAFADLPPAHIDLLLSRFQRIAVRRGEVVVRQGDPGDCYYLVERGRCAVVRQVGSSAIPLAELSAGAAFGEEALVADAPRNATVTMLSDGSLLRLGKRDFLDLLREPYLHALSREEADARVAAGARWLDVRFPAEFHLDGLPGAVNIPLNELRAVLPRLDAGTEYVVYCQSGRRSAAAAFLMARRGLKAFLLAEPPGRAADGARP